MAKYRLLENECVFDTEDNKNIPMVDGNSHYEKYKKWALSNTPDPIQVVTKSNDDKKKERMARYRNESDPLMMEALMEEKKGNTSAANALKDQAEAAYDQIKTDIPLS